MKVKSSSTGLIHFNAWCTVCEWRYQDYLTPSKGHRESKDHVSKTGHSVHVEEGLLTIYSTEQEGNLTQREADVAKAEAIQDMLDNGELEEVARMDCD